MCNIFNDFELSKFTKHFYFDGKQKRFIYPLRYEINTFIKNLINIYITLLIFKRINFYKIFYREMVATVLGDGLLSKLVVSPMKVI